LIYCITNTRILIYSHIPYDTWKATIFFYDKNDEQGKAFKK
jgi:hypothetical protein